MIAELEDLKLLSARLGADPMLIQGAGGNTSIKLGSTMWVKASGKWLERAITEEIFVALSLDCLRSLTAQKTDSGKELCIINPRDLKPSIETSLHAVFPQRVVLHVHSVQTVAWAIRQNAKELLEEKLLGIGWGFVPYHRPGMPLTTAVADLFGAHIPDVLVLGNHGLVVAANDCASAQDLLTIVERRLEMPPRPQVGTNSDALLAALIGSRYRLPKHEICHSLATDQASSAIAAAGSLYPDHVVFLGDAVALIEIDQLPATMLLVDPPPFLVVKGCGVVVRQDLTAGAEEMIRALALVVQRVPAGATLKYLSFRDKQDLLMWDAEKHRQALEKQKAVGK